MKIFTLFLLSLTACDLHEPDPTVDIDTGGTDEWLEDAVWRAAWFWAGHGVRFDISRDMEDADFPIWEIDRRCEGEDEGHCVLGFYDGDVIFIESRVEKKDEIIHECVVAHEIGHYLGMSHQGGQSLMAEHITACMSDGVPVCCWSEDDEEEFQEKVAWRLDDVGTPRD